MVMGELPIHGNEDIYETERVPDSLSGCGTWL